MDRGRLLILADELYVTGGCAGFLEVYPMEASRDTKEALPALKERLFVLSGSVNDVTRKQLLYGEGHGAYRCHVPMAKILTGTWSDDEKKECLAKVQREAEEFAEKSGWKQQVEDDASVLIVPVVSDWSKADRDLIPKLYQKYKTKCKAPSGVSIPGRDGALWLWEVAIYLVGYQDGADFAGDTLVKHPNYFAASALVDGRAHDFTSADAPTDFIIRMQMNKEFAKAVCSHRKSYTLDGTDRLWVVTDYLQSSEDQLRIGADDFTNVLTHLHWVCDCKNKAADKSCG